MTNSKIKNYLIKTLSDNERPVTEQPINVFRLNENTSVRIEGGEIQTFIKNPTKNQIDKIVSLSTIEQEVFSCYVSGLGVFIGYSLNSLVVQLNSIFNEPLSYQTVHSAIKRKGVYASTIGYKTVIIEKNKVK